MSWRCVSGCACVGGRVVHVEAGRREEGGRGGRKRREEGGRGRGGSRDRRG